MSKYDVRTIHHVRRMGTSVYGNPYYMITWDDLSFSRTKIDAMINYDLQDSENIGVPVVVEFSRAGRVKGLWPLDKAPDLKKYRWILYTHQPMGGFDVFRCDSIEQAKGYLKRWSDSVHVYEQASGTLYPYSKEDWAEAKEYEEIGCPFDYPSKVMSFGPRGGIKVENA